jgi:subtilisin family serine protease
MPDTPRGFFPPVAFLFVFLLFCLPPLLPVQSQSAPGEDLPASIRPPLRSHPKLDPALSRLIEIFHTGGRLEAEEFAGLRDLPSNGDTVRIIAECLSGRGSFYHPDGPLHFLIRSIQSQEGTVESAFRNLVQCTVPISSLSRLTEYPLIRYIRLPRPPLPMETSEGVASTQAEDWFSIAAYRSQGVKVGVLDAGFAGYENLRGTDLPSLIHARSFRADGNIHAGYVHGTACAEIIHDMAPDAEIYLANYSTIVEKGRAVEWLVSQGVNVISCSMGDYIGGPGNGTGHHAEIVRYAAERGAAWINAAGNGGEDHWMGAWSDTDDDGWLNFPDGGEILEFEVPPNRSLSVFLKWNDWGTWDGTSFGGSDQDYDLYLFKKSGNQWVLAGVSSGTQNGTQWPVESLSGFSSLLPRSWGVSIRKSSAAGNVVFDLYTRGNTGYIEHYVSAYSLCTPADSPFAFAVGATDWETNELHLYSSRGPTTDGRIKPDMSAPSGISTVSYGQRNFFGTSASCPHVAGAFALLKATTPFSISQIRAILESRALDLGTEGRDNLFGEGVLWLGASILQR